MKGGVNVSIRVKLAITMIAMVTLSIAVTGMFNYFISSSTVVEMTKSIMLQINKDNSNVIRSSIDKEMENVSIIFDKSEVISMVFRGN